jgi:hypothetical protein
MSMVKVKGAKPSVRRGFMLLFVDWAECGCGNSVHPGWGFTPAKKKRNGEVVAAGYEGNYTHLVCNKCGGFTKVLTAAQEKRDRNNEGTPVRHAGKVTAKQLRNLLDESNK